MQQLIVHTSASNNAIGQLAKCKDAVIGCHDTGIQL